ncbi:RpiR family transcriptional regulator [Roseovarius halotolerans]|uniref:Putative DNA-binding transcriptional regulator n=1 Tax=Roseovarius halotolerans TaxID=505353 RepID=A0A1X6ZSF0_9RHOB|nr:MurR/RpiR family transcriptional regulator [Roseovarius halotolerans]RKT27895.1 RpiR family transcriptional regulator [Roseovarius halotolerans]SLN59901.1 putative DNA-binding transcriptional regulator [Roseovarius halotolerans]
MTRTRTDRSLQATDAAAGEAGAPPQDVQELRDLMLRIARGESHLSLGPKAQKALAEILNLRGDPALLSITALAEKLSVNPSTLTRLARNLGYPGFGAFQQVLLDASMSAPGDFYTRQAQTALAGEDATGMGGIARLCRENQANIERFLESCDIDQFHAATDLITSAPRVMVHGIRQFHAFATFLVYGLRMIRSDVHLLDSNNLGVAEGLASMSHEDVLISASCAPYSAQVAATARAAAERDIKIVAVTDSASSALAAVSRAAILVPHQTSFLSNSLTTFILAAECLINGCGAVRPEQTKQALSARDEMIKRLDIEIS